MEVLISLTKEHFNWKVKFVKEIKYSIIPTESGRREIDTNKIVISKYNKAGILIYRNVSEPYQAPFAIRKNKCKRNTNILAPNTAIYNKGKNY
jgi:hypothetical protein